MISKEQKMKYGELLRQQIKEREEAKKAQRREYTPAQLPTILPQPQSQPQRIVQPSSPQINLDKFKSNREAQKELLAKKMQEQAYNPFGKIGSGAPNKQFNGQDPRQPKHIREPEQQIRLEEQQRPQFLEQQQPRENFMGDPMRMNVNGPPFQGYNRIPTPQFLQGAYNNVPFVGKQYASPAPYGYINVTENDIKYMGKIEITPRQMENYEPRYQHLNPNMNPQQPPPPLQMPYNPPEPYYPPSLSSKREEAVQRPQDNFQQNKMEEMQKDLFRKGGRNLLKFENEIPEHIISKQNEKLRLQQELKKQMEEVARRKKEEEQKQREEDERLEKINREFLEQEKKKYEQELNKQKGKVKAVDQDNLNAANHNANNNQPNAKRQKFQKIREEVAKREEEESKQAQFKNRQRQKEKENAFMRPPPRNNDIDEVQSVISGETQMSPGFNTAISKQFFRKEREKSREGKHKVDRLTSEMQKIRKELAHQGQQMHREVEKAHQEAELARKEKERADQEIHRLKQELREKMDYNNKRFLQEIYHGKIHLKDPYYADEVTLQQPNHRALRPRDSEKLILQEYRPEEHRQYEPQVTQTMRNDSDMASLIGDSKKIPLQLQANESLSISKLDRFAKDTDYFQNKSKQQALPRKYHPQDSIMQEDERRQDSRQSRRARTGRAQPQEELDRLIQSRKKSRGGWGELSSVNEEMVNQIEQMLQNRQRPRSHLASAGQNTLQTKEPTLNSSKNEPKRKASSVAEQESEVTLNTLDRLIRKYM